MNGKEEVSLRVTKEVERWGVFELTLEGPSHGNPFTDIRLCAVFKKERTYAEAEGFYDGNGNYRIRFMPEEEGVWTYSTSSNCSKLDGITGEFACTRPTSGHNGPVRVKGTVHFQYADGKRFTPIGTTSYGWHLQREELQEQTLLMLQHSPFNKIRMSVFPTNDEFRDAEPNNYPFEGTPEQGFDYSRLRPEYFSHLEKKVKDLAELGVQAELILWHPYDNGRWGFDNMSSDEDDRYLRYVIARLGAQHNVWWSLANDYDFMTHKSSEDWKRLFRLIQECDYGRHLRSIHNGRVWYDFGVPWVTHASIKSTDVRVVSECTKQFGKPVIIDECGFEGNLNTRWGSLTPEELVCRMWEGNCRGGYVTHGETYLNAEHVLWLSHGGEVQGRSVRRIEFMREILDKAPAHMAYSSDRLDAATLEVRGEYYLQYFGPHRFAYREFSLPDGKYEVDLIDTWNMTITPLTGTFEGRFRIDLPAKLYYALRIRKMTETSYK
ncbi:hypothetical protein ASG89_18485 [Paenibacillus sp. Soil766]|uniref:DUF5060 domain-containing protein n=1 Tax=Paenibacillus sp. Soil766 TaxID=1736404 RepID=UPI00070F3568|nr:DUF5060 domain-containing protein [Paenibacillus sp. Soil766]KRF06838.1 hypothetical protein ASG89_18485 [Paenibacillus sp. Soil766]